MDNLKNKKGQVAIIVAVVVVALVAGYFILQMNVEDDQGPEETGEIQEVEETEESSGEIGEDGSQGIGSGEVEEVPEIKEFDMIAKQWDFSPNTITVNQGDRVLLNIKSIDVDHGIAIPDFGVNEFLKPGEIVALEFTADKKGTFSFFCNVFCGSGHGSMKGTLIVN